MTADEVARAIDLLARGAWGDPFSVLGPHVAEIDGRTQVVVRTCRPDAAGAAIVLKHGEGDTRVAMTRSHPEGVFEAVIDEPKPPPYRLRLTFADGSTHDMDDPYRFGPVMGELDLHLFGEGRHLESWKKFGAHPMTIDGVAGAYFAVWAPSATRVSVVGEFNHWDGRVLPMRSLTGSGVWELFIPGLGTGTAYKYEIRSALGGGVVLIKSDPFASYAQVPPANASVVWDASGIAGATGLDDQEKDIGDRVRPPDGHLRSRIWVRGGAATTTGC